MVAKDYPVTQWNFFVDKKNSQSVLDAMVIDITASIGISICEEHFTKVKENSFHYITNFERRNYNVFSLTTQRFTEFSESEFFETVDSCNEKIVYCPEIKNGLIMYITFAIIQIAAKKYYCRDDTSNMPFLSRLPLKKNQSSVAAQLSVLVVQSSVVVNVVV